MAYMLVERWYQQVIRDKFNKKPLFNALDIISKLEPVEYDQTHDLVDQYTADIPQSHQCGFIAQ